MKNHNCNKNMRYSLLIILCFAFYPFFVNAQKNAKATHPILAITGFAHGFKDSTWLYLQYASGKMIDSSLVIQEQFYFQSKKLLTVKPTQYILRTKSYSDYKYFWMEDKPVIFSGVKGEFKNSLLAGSATQKLAEEFAGLYDSLYFEILGLRQNYGTADSTMRSRILVKEEELKRRYSQFIERNNTSFISAYYLSFYCLAWGKANTKELYTKLSPENQKNEFGIAISKFIKLNKNTNVGEDFADFELPSVDGNAIRLSSLKGKYILLDFWAAWCGPCRRENPNLVILYNKYKEKGFAVFGVSLDKSTAAWKKAIADDKLPWLNVNDLKGYENDAVLTYGIYEIPTNFLIDPSGKIIAKNLRGEELNKKLKELIGE